jgi:hypothetical protein
MPAAHSTFVSVYAGDGLDNSAIYPEAIMLQSVLQ